MSYPSSGRNPELYNGRLLVIHIDPETEEFSLVVYDMRPIVRGLEYPD